MSADDRRDVHRSVADRRAHMTASPLSLVAGQAPIRAKGIGRISFYVVARRLAGLPFARSLTAAARVVAPSACGWLGARYDAYDEAARAARADATPDSRQPSGSEEALLMPRLLAAARRG